MSSSITYAWSPPLAGAIAHKLEIGALLAVNRAGVAERTLDPSEPRGIVDGSFVEVIPGVTHQGLRGRVDSVWWSGRLDGWCAAVRGWSVPVRGLRRATPLPEEEGVRAAPARAVDSDEMLAGRMCSALGLSEDRNYVGGGSWRFQSEEMRAEMRAAWSRELRRKVDAVEAVEAERERTRVTCQSQYEMYEDDL